MFGGRGIYMSQVPLEVLDPLELQLEVVVSCLIWVLTTELLLFQEQWVLSTMEILLLPPESPS